MSHSARRRQADRVAESGERLLLAATELFALQGFATTTAGEIGERAGYSRAMVRERFGSKEALLEQLLAREIEPRMQAEDPSGMPGYGCLLHRAGVVIGLMEEHPTLMRAFWVMSFESVGGSELLRQWTQQWLDQYEQSVAAAVERGQLDGSIAADIRPSPAARGVINTCLGIAFRWCLDPSHDLEDSTSQWHEDLARQFMPRRTEKSWPAEATDLELAARNSGATGDLTPPRRASS